MCGSALYGGGSDITKPDIIRQPPSGILSPKKKIKKV
jgi:hypothetical protein